MDRLKTLAMYASWVILFYLFSNLLIFIGLNASYKNMDSEKSETPSQVQINDAKVTSVNGRIRGTISNDGTDDLNGKFMKVDLFSKNNTLLGTEYVNINELPKGEKSDFDLNFKAQGVDHYKISIVDKIEKVNNELHKVEFLKRPLTGYEVLALLVLLIIAG